MTLCLLVLFAAAPPALAQEPPLRIAYCTGCTPTLFRDAEGHAAGIISDHWRLWAEKTGRRVEFVGATWEESLRLVREGERCRWRRRL